MLCWWRLGIGYAAVVDRPFSESPSHPISCCTRSPPHADLSSAMLEAGEGVHAGNGCFGLVGLRARPPPTCTALCWRPHCRDIEVRHANGVVRPPVTICTMQRLSSHPKSVFTGVRLSVSRPAYPLRLKGLSPPAASCSLPRPPTFYMVPCKSCTNGHIMFVARFHTPVRPGVLQSVSSYRLQLIIA